MLLMERNRRLRRARTHSEQLIQQSVQHQLRWMQIRLTVHFRRLARGKRKKLNARNMRQLRKQEGFIPSLDQLWAEFRRRLDLSLHEQFRQSAQSMIQVEEDFFGDNETIEELDLEGFRLSLNSDEVVRLFEGNISQLVTNLTTETRSWVGNQVANWYLTPGSNLTQLMAQLDQKFNEVRSKLIGVNEITALNSLIVQQVMRQLGILKWFWQTAQDEIVCTRLLTGPDGSDYNGCAELQGQTFTIDMPMPPDASHIGCRCSAIYDLERSKQGQPVDLIPELSLAEG